MDKDFGSNKKLKIVEFKVNVNEDAFNDEYLSGRVVTEQYPFNVNGFIRYSGGGIAWDDPHKLTKAQKDYIKRKIDSYKKPTKLEVEK
jgi:hypothetical protein